MTNAERWKATSERLARERLARRTPEEVEADEKRSAKHLADLASQVTRIPSVNGGAVVKGEPSVLKEICRMFGFKNDCRDGGVYLTARKIRILFSREVTDVTTPTGEPSRATGGAGAGPVVASPVAGDTETAGTLVFSEAVALLLRPSRFVALVPAEPEQSVSATVAAIVHGYEKTETRAPERFEVLTVLERLPAGVAR